MYSVRGPRPLTQEDHSTFVCAHERSHGLGVVAHIGRHVALDAIVRADLVAHDVVPDHADPGVAHGEIVEEL
eukprot:238935-Prymnesium_polylepis.1